MYFTPKQPGHFTHPRPFWCKTEVLTQNFPLPTSCFAWQRSFLRKTNKLTRKEPKIVKSVGTWRLYSCWFQLQVVLQRVYPRPSPLCSPGAAASPSACPTWKPAFVWPEYLYYRIGQFTKSERGSERDNYLWCLSIFLWSFSLSPPLSLAVNEP